MKKLIRKVITLTLLMMVCLPTKVKAEEVLNIKATAYCYNSGTTATGTIPKEGRTLAGKREWFGKIACVWEDKGNGIEPENFIGSFIVEDTGGEPIRKGYVVDVFIEDYEEAKKFGSKNVIVVLIDAKG